jgi:hypothetical protein
LLQASPNGSNNWNNIFTEFFTQRIDGTSKGTTKGFSDIVATFNSSALDTTPPVITINSPTNTTYAFGQAVPADYTCTDIGGAGVATCVGTVADGANINTSSGGPKTFTVNSTDTGGLSSSLSVTYNVLHSTGACLGAPGHQILQPIDADGSSVFKKGSTVPAKFRVCDAQGNSIGTSGTVVSFKLVKTVSGTAVAYPDEAVVSTTPDNAFRWSPTDQLWIFNLNTKSLQAGKTYYYEITLNDGSVIKFNFGLR